MPATLPDSEIIARSDANFVETFRMLARITEGGEVRDFGGVTRVFTGLPAAMFNIAFVTGPRDIAVAHLADSASFFRSRGVPFVVRFCGGQQGADEETAHSLALSPADAEPGMALLNSVPVPPAMNGLRITVARDPQAIADHAEVCAKGFGMPLELAQALASPALLAVRDAEVYVGYMDAKPVTSSALFFNNGVAGVYNVATIDAHRRKGLGEAMTWHAVRRGRELGCLFSSLQASDMGKPVYERMGFRVVTTYPTLAG